MVDYMVGEMSKILTIKNVSKSPAELSKMVWPKIEEAVIKIKQAFTDEGYATEKQIIDRVWNDGTMTGQEWFNRFMEEADSWLGSAHIGTSNSVIEAAKKAAGISDER